MKMKNKSVKFISLLLLYLFFFPLVLLTAPTTKDIPKKHKKWLEEDVVYIITPKEKEVFLQLETDKERDLFIEAFWKHRDPTPGTPENEHKQEHYKRITHANHKFGVGSPLPGWKTDRGKIYIILGEPLSIDNYSSQRELRDTEIWFYQGLTKYGLPTAFHVVFYRKGYAADFELYSPASDGPYSLFIRPPNIDPADYLAAYEALKNINTNVAEVSLSLIPGDLSLVSGRPSLTSEILLQNITLKPQKEVDDLYAEKMLKYKSIVEVDYSANYIDSDYLIQAIKDKSGLFFVHYLISPKRLSVAQYERTYYANFQVNGTISDLEDRMVYQFEKEYAVNLDEDSLQTMSSTPFQINDLFPLIPGTFKFSLLLKNTVSKEFSSFEVTINIPDQITAPSMSRVLLSYNSQDMRDSHAFARPFQINDKLLFCEPKVIFLPSEEMTLYFQLYEMDQESQKSSKVKFSVKKGDETVSGFSRSLSFYQDPRNIIEEIPLSSFVPADYTLEISIQDEDGKDLLTQTKNFSVSPVPTLPRPLIKANALPTSHNALNEYRIGSQLYNQGKFEEAQSKLENAFQLMPGEMDLAIQLAKTHFALNNYGEIEKILSPFLNQETTKYEVPYYLGRSALALSDYGKAIQFFRDAISQFGINTNLLNLLGECYHRLNDLQEARAAWQRSLEINPDQPEIRQILNSIKDKLP